jgi:hypothetical protein
VIPTTLAEKPAIPFAITLGGLLSFVQPDAPKFLIPRGTLPNRSPAARARDIAVREFDSGELPPYLDLRFH